MDLKGTMTMNKRIIELAEKQRTLEHQVIQLEKKLKATKIDLRCISEGALPEAMDEADVEAVTLSSGETITIKDNMYASLAKKNHPEIATWLREVEAESLIVHEVGVKFGRGKDNVAGALAGKLLEEWGDLAYDRTTIHTGSVKALCKELMENGQEIPMELLGISMVREAVLSQKKS